MSQLLSQITTLLEKNQPENRHSLFQLKYFVLGKEPTHQARLRKSLNELAIRKVSLDNFMLAIEEAKDNIELLDIQLENIDEQQKETKKPLDIRQMDVEIRKLKRQRKSLENQIYSLEGQKKECEIETEFFLNAFRSLEQVEPLKPFDDLETNMEIWNEKYAQALNLSLLLQRPLEFEFVNSVLALDNNMPIKKELINILDQVQNQAMAAQKARKELDIKTEAARIPTENKELDVENYNTWITSRLRKIANISEVIK